MRKHRIGGPAVVAIALCGTVLGTVGRAAAEPGGDAGGRQRAFAAAAQEYGVPESVLLGVAYLESRWDANAGAPSSSAGYGPMHLTDYATAMANAPRPDGDGDARGDEARPLAKAAPGPAASEPTLQTADRAAALTGVSKAVLESDPGQNIRGGAALLADQQRRLGAPVSADPAQWYGSVARYGGASDAEAGRQFADEVYGQIAQGASRVTDDGQSVTLPATPVNPVRDWLKGLPSAAPGDTECPAGLACESVPAPYQKLSADPTDYGNHDLADRPRSQKIDYIVIHDTETSYADTLRLVQDPTYVSWHYTIRSADGHVAQHVKTMDVAWQAGNWYVNAKSVGIEHEGFMAQGGAWYTEAMYRSSAKLVRYLARRNGVPLDRAHIIGHDNVPGTVPETIRRMHVDPGPYWDWAHYFDLLGAPLHGFGGHRSGLVMIKPDFVTNQVPFTGCDAKHPAEECPAHGSTSVMLRTEPRPDAPLVKDAGKNPPNGDSTMDVYDHGARAATGQVYAVAERRADWTAIWYLGQKSWLYDRAAHPATVPSLGLVVTPRPGLASVPVYGRAYPEASAYPANVPVQALAPLTPYTFAAGQRYAVSGFELGEYYYAKTFDVTGHVVVRGREPYVQVQFGHRVMFVKLADVQLRPSFLG